MNPDRLSPDVATSVKERVILNLGCGTKTSAYPGVVNIDWSMYLRLKRAPIIRHIAPVFLDTVRRERLAGLSSNVVTWNLARGIPYADESVDVVYHSHFLEHLDRDIAVALLKEAKRVLRPGGVHRIVVPDLEVLARNYLASLEHSILEPDVGELHDLSISALFEQSVRREAAGARERRGIRRWADKLLLGDARRRGETHQWMYDRVSLRSKLLGAGYLEATLQAFDQSAIPEWNRVGLDTDGESGEYRPGSLYMEAFA